jgi:hypothetical protein
MWMAARTLANGNWRNFLPTSKEPRLTQPGIKSATKVVVDEVVGTLGKVDVSGKNVGIRRDEALTHAPLHTGIEEIDRLRAVFMTRAALRLGDGASTGGDLPGFEPYALPRLSPRCHQGRRTASTLRHAGPIRSNWAILCFGSRGPICLSPRPPWSRATFGPDPFSDRQKGKTLWN